MRRSPAFAAALLLMLAYVHMHAQTTGKTPVKATRIEYANALGMMNATIRAVLVSGQQSTPLAFEEAKSSFVVFRTFATKPFTVSTGARITGDISSVLHLVSMPRGERRCCVHWSCDLTLIDAANGEALAKGLSGIWCNTQRPMDTLMGNSFMVDLSRFSGRRVYLQIKAVPEPEMLATERLTMVEIDPSKTNNIH
ncbi:MAG: hypothetical protein JST22_17195 [Bacteroidetes bacterium]|nr:hypothetical protein [Bacteroidota bacterium]